MTVELGEAFQHTFHVVAKNPQSGGTVSAPLVSAGKYTVTVSATPTTDPHLVRLAFGLYGSGQPVHGYSFEVNAGAIHTVVVTTDPVKHVLEVTMDGDFHLGRTLLGDAEPIHVDSSNPHSQGTRPALSVTETATAPQPTLCQDLIH